MVAPDGTSLICCGLDYWFESEDPARQEIDPSEFYLSEWRLQRDLEIDYLVLPPDFRQSRFDRSRGEYNRGLTIPFLRFPQWHVCPKCHLLEQVPLSQREVPRCSVCTPASSKWKPTMVQVRFIAICDQGHMQDFPWKEWVHRDQNPTCGLPMKLKATGGASLAATKVACQCGKSRSLDSITNADTADAAGEGLNQSTYLSRKLSSKGEYRCRGTRPWLGDVGEGCGRSVRGSLRGATNVYFSVIRSAIYLPRRGDGIPSELVDLIEGPQITGLLKLLVDAGRPVTPGTLRKHYGSWLAQYSDLQVGAALELLNNKAEEIDHPVVGDDSETAFRRAEFSILRTDRAEAQLETRVMDRSSYDPSIAEYFSTISLVPKLRETRTLTGFTRVFPENDQSLEERKSALWRHAPEQGRRWLPAYVVFGEGIFLEFNEAMLQDWERVAGFRVSSLSSLYRQVQARRRLRERRITPRLVLLHTFSHIVINQLTFECGYGSASLRERLYVSSDKDAPMAGILIYTAAGDSDGTLGGLVRMGKAGNLEAIIRRALDRASWCSADPVCMEQGRSGGQGPDSCNLAACHNCGLVPETSCEEFNRFLDRGLIVGTPESPGLGFFRRLV
jgi:Domain of unknown function (DUF1998)